MAEEQIKQGVRSVISFPLSQDEIAIGQAISCLLKEGWKFRELRKTEIIFERFWEYDSDKEQGQEEPTPQERGREDEK